jgi:hypothetical protein
MRVFGNKKQFKSRVGKGIDEGPTFASLNHQTSNCHLLGGDNNKSFMSTLLSMQMEKETIQATLHTIAAG